MQKAKKIMKKVLLVLAAIVCGIGFSLLWEIICLSFRQYIPLYLNYAVGASLLNLTAGYLIYIWVFEKKATIRSITIVVVIGIAIIGIFVFNNYASSPKINVIESPNIFSSTPQPIAITPTVDSNVERTMEYWKTATPILKDGIEKWGQPLAYFITTNSPAIYAGNRDVYSQLILKLKDVQPLIAKSFQDLSALQPPSGIASEWQMEQLKSWGMRLDAINMMIGHWNPSFKKYVCSEDEIQEQSDLWDNSMLSGQEADRLQIKLTKYIADNTNK